MAIEEHVSTNGEFLEYARRELWNSATLVRRAFHCLSLIVLGVIVATGIFLGAVAAVAIFASNKIDVCNNWEIASHRGGVSVWRQVSLFVVNHRVTFSINSERAEDRYGRPIITSVLHRRPNEHWTGPAILLNSFQKPAPFIIETMGVKYESSSSHLYNDWTNYGTRLTFHPVHLIALAVGLILIPFSILRRTTRNKTRCE